MMSTIEAREWAGEFLVNNDWEVFEMAPPPASRLVLMKLRIADMEDDHPALAEALGDRASRTLQIMSYATHKTFVLVASDRGVIPRFSQIPKERCIPLAGIRAEHVDRLFQVDGVVAKVGPVEPVLLMGRYVCQFCGAVFSMRHEPDDVRPPAFCDVTIGGCDRDRVRFDLLHEECCFVDGQRVQLTDRDPDGLGTLELQLLHDDAGVVAEGDAISVAGVLTARPTPRRKDGTVRHVFGMRWPTMTRRNGTSLT